MDCFEYDKLSWPGIYPDNFLAPDDRRVAAAGVVLALMPIRWISLRAGSNGAVIEAVGDPEGQVGHDREILPSYPCVLD